MNSLGHDFSVTNLKRETISMLVMNMQNKTTLNDSWKPRTV